MAFRTGYHLLTDIIIALQLNSEQIDSFMNELNYNVCLIILENEMDLC
jgi:hypothetical protein